MAFADVLAGFIRLLSGSRSLPGELGPSPPAIYFGNHSSHLDFMIIWACLPPACRRHVRPVAGRDYWEKTALRQWLALRVFHAVLIERQRVTVANNPLESMLAALDHGSSLIVFPEGTRSPDGVVRDFKSGLCHLARSRPQIPLIPVYLENLNRILPKGGLLPVPLIAMIHAGPPIWLQPDESKTDFLARAKNAVVSLTETSSP